MKLRYGFGNGFQEVEVPEKNLIGELHANPVPPGLPEAEEVARALREPIGTPRLQDIVHPGEKIAVITSDVTRPMPTAKVMPLLLDELYAGGVKPETPERRGTQAPCRRTRFPRDPLRRQRSG